MATINKTIEFKLSPSDIADAFWEMTAGEQCLFFERLYNVSKSDLSIQLQYVTESVLFSDDVKRCMSKIGEYGNE